MDIEVLSASSLSALTAPVAAADQRNAAAERKAEEFEALVLSQMLAPMFETAKSPGLFGGDGPEQDIFRTMLNDEYAKLLAARGGVGIADSVKGALLQLQSDNNTIEGTMR